MFDEQLPDDVFSVHIGRMASDPKRQLVTVRLVSPFGGLGGVFATAATFDDAYAAALAERASITKKMEPVNV